MGRPRFSFPLPGRRSKADKENASSKPSVSPVPAWPSSYAESSGTSKAHRVLGTSEPLCRTTSKQSSKQSSSPPSSAYMTISVSDSGTDARSTPATEYSGYQTRPGLPTRLSLNAPRHPYTEDGETRRGSDNSCANHLLQPQTSSSTMRSHYDAKNSPLSISQQTSDSAVRDMALRRGKPQVVGWNHDHTDANHESFPVTRETANENKREGRKSKPTRLDISKLFPRPRSGGEGQSHPSVLHSPTKMVNSPAAMSMSSEYLPCSMNKGPTSQPARSRKTASRQGVPESQRSSSPVRLFQRDVYDNAKINVRRPPKGIQHWFEAGSDQDSDGALEEVRTRAPVYAQESNRQKDAFRLPRRTSFDCIFQDPTQHEVRTQQSVPVFNTHSFAHEDVVDVHCLTSASEYSAGRQSSRRKKEFPNSSSNLQDSSMVSFSSLEDEGDRRHREDRFVRLRESLDIGEDTGEVIIGEAHTFEVRPKQRLSAAMSILSNATDAATIEVMYTPEASFSQYQHYMRGSNFSGSRRSSHIRQPSVIPEDEGLRPRTGVSTVAHSTLSGRTSASEPRPDFHVEHKMMAVTAEEEALLELMRKKRAAMNRSSQASSNSAGEQMDRQPYASGSAQKPYRTSAFLSTETPAASPVRVVETKAKRRSATHSMTLSLFPQITPTSTLHEKDLHYNLGSDASSDRYLPPARKSSHVDSYLRASPTLSPTNTDHLSSLSSPMTPGSLTDEAYVRVKVASSETSNDDEVSGVESGVTDTQIDSTKPSHNRRRTASSDVDMAFPAPPGHSAIDFTSVSRVSSHAPSVLEPQLPKLAGTSSKRMSAMTLSTSSYGNPRTRQSSIVSSHSHTSSRGSRMDRKNSLASMNGSTKTRNSVSDDILAAWGSLGGTY